MVMHCNLIARADRRLQSPPVTTQQKYRFFHRFLQGFASFLRWRLPGEVLRLTVLFQRGQLIEFSIDTQVMPLRVNNWRQNSSRTSIARNNRGIQLSFFQAVYGFGHFDTRRVMRMSSIKTRQDPCSRRPPACRER
jgi:hypothetical protein